MTYDSTLMESLESRSKRREERRDFFRFMGAAAALPAFTLTMGGTPLHAQAAPSDGDILNFALNLEYLEAQFYFYAVFGQGLPNSLLGGVGTQGAVTGGRAVNFTDPLVAQYAREIAMDERAHVAFLRQAIGSQVIARPSIDVGTDPNGAFSSAARAAGLVGPGQAFDAYANDENFLLAAFIFEDVGVTAYKGAAPLLANKTFLEAAAGLLAAEAYHAGLIRTVLYAKGLQAPTLRSATESISNARDSLDGPSDLDQGVAPIGSASNIVPTDGNALAFSRSTGQVLNIAFLTKASTDRGGFFPVGVNGNIRLSAAS